MRVIAWAALAAQHLADAVARQRAEAGGCDEPSSTRSEKMRKVDRAAVLASIAAEGQWTREGLAKQMSLARGLSRDQVTGILSLLIEDGLAWEVGGMVRCTARGMEQLEP